MEELNSRVYFALFGDNFSPELITDTINLKPTESWQKGDKGKYNNELQSSAWILSTDKKGAQEHIPDLMHEIVDQLFDKIEIVNNLNHKKASM